MNALRTLRPLLLLTPGLLTIPLAAQDFSRSNKRYAGKFHYEAARDEEVQRTWFHYVVSKTADDHWVVRTFYPETGQMTGLMTYSNKQLTTLDGPYARWYDNGGLRTQGAHSKGERTGPWVNADIDGSRREGRYARNKEQGIWNSWDTQGRQRQSIPYLDGSLHGIGHSYDTTGVVQDTLVYERGTLLNGGPPPDVVERMPCLVLCDSIANDEQRNACTEGMIMKHLQTNIHYPPDAIEMNVTGQALFQFTIDKDGQLVDVQALNGLCRSIETECRRVFATLPPWKPGRQDGRFVQVCYNQPVKFELR